MNYVLVHWSKDRHKKNFEIIFTPKSRFFIRLYEFSHDTAKLMAIRGPLENPVAQTPVFRLRPLKSAFSEPSSDLHNTAIIPGEKSANLLTTWCIIEPRAGQLVIITLQMSLSSLEDAVPLSHEFCSKSILRITVQYSNTTKPELARLYSQLLKVLRRK